MYLRSSLYDALAQVDDGDWQQVLQRHPFWQAEGSRLDGEHQDIAFHILMHEGELGDHLAPSDAAFEFDAVPVPPPVFQDPDLAARVQHWSDMHAANYGPGLTIKMGLYVIRAGGTLGFHVDGPVFLKGMRVDLSDETVQRGLVEVQASHRTILPLRFNEDDRFMVCGFRAPLRRGELFEFNNVLPHAYFNRGSGHAVLLVTTYLEEALLPAQFDYRAAVPA
ncbi:hypothetical protein [Ramlibacter humi]|uniref:Aspartyl/asparaginy/proline hydroxylase domain-containing protein n=1 Tax=Ramlibacter humi TaxID=2530451 RepID=A0A4Z0BFA4_9BURK|nr:hypothetical protein [Ramlibacter humi]TFY97059.1 hypothetical protein EZ216_19555 [Ramlibacter humi]